MTHNPNALPPRRFFAVLSTVVGVLLSAVAGLNFWVDPTQLFVGKGLPRSNCAPGVRAHDLMGLVSQVSAARPSVLMLGSSRVAYGHDTASLNRAFGTHDAMLVGSPAAGIVSLADSLLPTLSTRGPGTLLIGVGVGETWDVLMRRVRGKPSIVQVMSRFHHGLLSPSSTRASLGIIFSPTGCAAPRYDANGNVNQSYFQKPIAAGGHQAFAQASLRGHSTLVSAPSAVEISAVGDAFQKMSAQQCERQAQTIAVVLPVHASLLALIHTAGRWPSVEDTLRTLAVRSETLRVQGCRVDFWDFTGIRAETSAPFERGPEMGNHSFWDPSHYRPTLGARVIERVISGADSRADHDFGVRLRPDNVEAHIKLLRAQLQRYVDDQPDEIASYRVMLGKARGSGERN